jgi:predicted nucleic acid-binding protein
VVDSNIIFSALLKKENICHYIITSNYFDIYTCNYMFTELFKHRNKLMKCSHLEETEIISQLENILSKISFINENIIPSDIYRNAELICTNIDPYDVPFVSLAIFLNIPLLTTDKKLYNGLKLLEFPVFNLIDIKCFFDKE